MRTILLLIFASFQVMPGAYAQLDSLPEDRGLSGLGLALRRLPTTGSVLYITAHPDDENNALITWLSRGRGLRVGLLTLTRGEGGQNEIGPELGEALGVLRSEELLRVHRFDRVEQFFTRACEFGYSFSVEETFEKWGERETLGDIVRVIRTFRPDVILTMMPDGEGGGQHHQASARLAASAFEVAAQPNEFRDQIEEGLRAWETKKLYRVPFSRQTPELDALTIEVGEYDELLGMSYAEYGALARNSHRCQGMNAAARPGKQSASLLLEFSRIPKSADDGSTLLSGIDATWKRWTSDLQAQPECRDALMRFGSRASRILQGFPRRNRAALASELQEGIAELRLIRRLVRQSETIVKADILFQLERAESDWIDASMRAQGLVFRSVALVEDGCVVRGETFSVATSIVNHGAAPVALSSLVMSMPGGWKAEKIDGRVGRILVGEVITWRHRVTVGDAARFSSPHWHRPANCDALPSERFEVSAPPQLAIRPFLPPALQVELEFSSFGVAYSARSAVQHRWFDPGSAKHRSMALKVVPGLSLRVTPALRIVPLNAAGKSLEIRATIRNNFASGSSSAVVELELPESWKKVPARSVKFLRENGEFVVSFDVQLPANLIPGDRLIRVKARCRGSEFRSGYDSIAYHHIETRHLYHPAESVLRFCDVEIPPGLEVGYVMGVGDKIPEALESFGVSVDLLDADDLASARLGRYDVIITGIRAYKDREDLIAHNRRLLDYVHEGGTMICQYNKYEFLRAEYAPFPLSIAKPHDRVTDENAPIKILQPESAVFLRPNHITAVDWEGWVQERGLYFLHEWDERYVPLLEMEDPFPYNRGRKSGALVMGKYGRGVYFYTGLGFFRQLPAGVPGAYRLFANLLSYRP